MSRVWGSWRWDGMPSEGLWAQALDHSECFFKRLQLRALELNSSFFNSWCLLNLLASLIPHLLCGLDVLAVEQGPSRAMATNADIYCSIKSV